MAGKMYLLLCLLLIQEICWNFASKGDNIHWSFKLYILLYIHFFRLEAECIGVNGEPCIFPFLYEGITFDKCTYYDANFGEAWCALTVTSEGEMETWKACDVDACKGIF